MIPSDTPAVLPDPSERLELVVDGRQVEATLARFPASPEGIPRQPRWMLSIDGQPVRGPLTWDAPLDTEVERAAIAAFLAERRAVAIRYRETHGEVLRQLRDSGALVPLANALGVLPADLVD